jgi:hypothetical protein
MSILIETIPFEQIKKIGIHANTYNNRLTCAQVQQKYQADYVMNFGLYKGDTYLPVLSLKSEDQWLVKEDNFEGLSFDENGISFGKAYDSIYKNFVTGYPTLIRGGNIADFTDPSDMLGDRGRSGAGIGEDYNLVLSCIGEEAGDEDYTLTEFANRMIQYKVRSFINLDGGLSSQCIFPTGTITSPRVVQNFLYIILYKPVYRVQVGSYRDKQRSYNFANQCSEILNNNGIITTPFIQTYYL